MCFMTVYSLTVSLLLTDTVTGRSQLVGTPCLEHFAGGDNDVANALNNLKTWLFRKSYPDIVMWTFLIQTINLEVALLHRQTLIDWLIDWYICLTYMYFKCKQAKWNNFFVFRFWNFHYHGKKGWSGAHLNNMLLTNWLEIPRCNNLRMSQC